MADQRSQLLAQFNGVQRQVQRRDCVGPRSVCL